MKTAPFGQSSWNTVHETSRVTCPGSVWLIMICWSFRSHSRLKRCRASKSILTASPLYSRGLGSRCSRDELSIAFRSIERLPLQLLADFGLQLAKVVARDGQEVHIRLSTPTTPFVLL